MSMVYLDHLNETCELCQFLLNKYNDPPTVIKEVMKVQKERADYTFVKVLVEKLHEEKREEKVLEDRQCTCKPYLTEDDICSSDRVVFKTYLSLGYTIPFCKNVVEL